MRPLMSVAEQGLVPVPPMSDTSHLQECGNRLAMVDNIDASSGLVWPQPGTTEGWRRRMNSPASVMIFGSWFSRGPWPSFPSGRKSSKV